MFATDRDLVVLEPGLLGEAGWLGQQLAQSAIASIDSTGLLVTATDAKFSSAGIGAGYVVRADGAAYEVISVGGETQMVVSRVRVSQNDTPIPGTPGGGLELSVMTFRPQIETIHRQVMRMGGIEPDGTEGDGVVTESSIVNPDELKELEAIGALHLIYTAMSAGCGPDSASRDKADIYRVRFETERRRAGLRIDLDGDGEADAVRRLNSFRMVRG